MFSIAIFLNFILAAVAAEHCKFDNDCDMNNCAAGTMPKCANHRVCTCESAQVTAAPGKCFVEP